MCYSTYTNIKPYILIMLYAVEFSLDRFFINFWKLNLDNILMVSVSTGN